MTPSLYDLLDVDPDASERQIRRAWRNAIAELDPTDRRFRAYNRAAEVLLDPERRREHDAVLAAEAAEEEAEEETSDEPVDEPATTEQAREPAEPVVVAPAAAAAVTGKSPVRKTPVKVAPAEGEPAATKPAAKKPAEKKKPAATKPAEKKPAEKKPAARTTVRSGGARRAVPTWVLAAVGVLTLAVVAATVFFGFVQDPGGTAAGSDDVAAAQDAAETAAVPVLSYDYRHLADDEASATSYMTDAYARQYGCLFDKLRPNVEDQQAVVDAQVMASGIAGTGEGRVDVLVFVNQITTKKGVDEPQTLKMWATMQMVDDGGDWLVDKLIVDTQGDTPTEADACS